jgi:hypothetical protein
VFGREEERVLAETLWSRLRLSIGKPALDLERSSRTVDERILSSRTTTTGSARTH